MNQRRTNQNEGPTMTETISAATLLSTVAEGEDYTDSDVRALIAAGEAWRTNLNNAADLVRDVAEFELEVDVLESLHAVADGVFNMVSDAVNTLTEAREPAEQICEASEEFGCSWDALIRASRVWMDTTADPADRQHEKGEMECAAANARDIMDTMRELGVDPDRTYGNAENE